MCRPRKRVCAPVSPFTLCTQRTPPSPLPLSSPSVMGIEINKQASGAISRSVNIYLTVSRLEFPASGVVIRHLRLNLRSWLHRRTFVSPPAAAVPTRHLLFSSRFVSAVAVYSTRREGGRGGRSSRLRSSFLWASSSPPPPSPRSVYPRKPWCGCRRGGSSARGGGEGSRGGEK